MAFEDYSPQDRRLTGHAHAGSWLIFGALVALLAIMGPEANSGNTSGQIAATTPSVQDDCAV